VRKFLPPTIALILLLLAIPRGMEPRRLGALDPLAGPAPSPERIEADIAALSAFPTRFAGSEQTPAVLEWLRAAIRERGFTPLDQSFPLKVGLADTEQTNLYCLLPGRDPRKPWLLLIAHYDSINEGWAGDTSSFEDPESPAPGADDNASGVAVLLETLRLLGESPSERGVICLFSAAEELGQAGARAFAELPLASRRGIGWVINVDQVGKGRMGPRSVQLYSREQGLPIMRRLREIGRGCAPELLGWRLHRNDLMAKSDHGPFLDRGFAALSLSEGPGYYAWEVQGAGDLPGRLDPVLMTAVARLLSATARDPLLPRPPR
jgi:hypothetical protein